MIKSKKLSSNFVHLLTKFVTKLANVTYKICIFASLNTYYY